MAAPVPVQTAAGIEPAFDLAAYFPILVYAVVVVLFGAGTVAASHLFPLKPRKPTRVKEMPYESGMDPVGSARMQFDIKFHLIAILFLVFDVELLFLYPWAVIAYADGGDPTWKNVFGAVVFVEILVFLATLAIAYVYAWKKGVFQWR
jgi:NADH-quinone oxidoreductase subunit A